MSGIQEQNIMFVASQVMDDVPEGGGAATGNPIPDGVMNNVFEDVSDLDRAMGRFNMRKLFLAVRTANTDLFGGAKSIVTMLPDDPAIGYTLFTTDDAFDTREEAANRVEAYLFKGPLWNGVLWENHIEGMRQIRVIQRKGTAVPPRGKTLCIVQAEGQSGEKEQYIRVTEVTSEVQTFTDSSGEFQKLIVTMSLSDPLRFNFTGFTPNRTDSYSFSIGARIRDTTVADATRYFGAQPLRASVDLGDQVIPAQSMFTQLVPSAQSEDPISNQPLNPQLVQQIDAGSRDVDVPQPAHTLGREVTAENRRLNWVETLNPIPAPDTFTVSYMAQGNWYTLSDDGAGTISGSDPNFGSGTIDYSNGSMTVTLGALPDVGSQIIFIYGSRVHFEVISGSDDRSVDEAVFPFELSNAPVVASSVDISWDEDGTTKTATVDNDGVISGDASGTLNLSTGEGELVFSTLPTRGTDLSFVYQWYEGSSGGSVRNSESLIYSTTLTLEHPTVPDAIRLRFELVSGTDMTNTDHAFYAVGRANGDLVVPKQQVSPRQTSQGGGNIYRPRPITEVESVVSEQVIGSISGDTITLNTSSITVESKYRKYKGFLGWQQGSRTVSMSIDQTENISATYTLDGVTQNSVSGSDDIALDQLKINLAANTIDMIVTDSVEFSFGGKTYQDRAGDIVTDIDPQTGSALVAGSIDYSEQEGIITYWDAGAQTELSVSSMLVVYGEWSATEGVFRTPAAPLKPEALQLIATTLDGEQLIITADANGEFNHDSARGTVNYTFGTAEVEFGSMVATSSLTQEDLEDWWYNEADVTEEDTIWKPRQVMTSTLRYNAVSFTYIPLDSEIVGIDAVRLPSDGRVPIFRVGDVVMVMHPVTEAPQTVANDDVVLLRPRLGWVKIRDANGDTVTEGYELNRATGEVTFTDISGMVMPITIKHTVGDLRLVTDVQINGDLQVSRPVTHDYPVGESLVASCLVHGDRRARVSQVWDEETWNGNWVDNRVGDEATATLNLIDHPITVTNEGADTDRWVLRCVNASSNLWELISQNRGLVWQGSFDTDIAPINPRTRGEDGQGGVPYMTIPAAANGGGWSTGNVIRINTEGAIADFWMARSIQQSDEPLDDGEDGCEIYALGNIDRP